MKNQKGFSLIELLIVVVIIGIIAAIAIPNLLAARRSANEGSAISTLRTYHGAQTTYQATGGGGNYAGTPNTINAFWVLSNAGLLDATLLPASAAGYGVKSGYNFLGHSIAASAGTAPCFLGFAPPVTDSGLTQTGTRAFAIATEGVLHSSPAPGATAYSGTSGAAACTIVASYTPLNN